MHSVLSEFALATHLLEFVADEGERLVDGVRGARDGDDPLRTRAVADVDLGAALKEFSCQPGIQPPLQTSSGLAGKQVEEARERKGSHIRPINMPTSK